jgi:ketosteroid isomerase-like protein
MGTQENKQLLQDVFAALAQSDARPFVRAMAEDFRWTLMGRNSWSRTYEGKAAVINELFGALATRMDRITTIPDRFIAEDDFVVVQAHGANTTRDGVPYNNSYCFVFRLEGGKLKELSEYMDTEMATQVLGEPAPRAAE